jgi:hypothetical protein
MAPRFQAGLIQYFSPTVGRFPGPYPQVFERLNILFHNAEASLTHKP